MQPINDPQKLGLSELVLRGYLDALFELMNATPLTPGISIDRNGVNGGQGTLIGAARSWQLQLRVALTTMDVESERIRDA